MSASDVQAEHLYRVARAAIGRQHCRHSATEVRGNQYDHWSEEYSLIHAEMENERHVHGLESYCVDCFDALWFCDNCGWNDREHDFGACYAVEQLRRGHVLSREPE